MGIWLRKPRKSVNPTKQPKNISIVTKPKVNIFGTSDLKTRTNDYYKDFAKGTLENDIEREKK